MIYRQVLVKLLKVENETGECTIMEKMPSGLSSDFDAKFLRAKLEVILYTNQFETMTVPWLY